MTKFMTGTNELKLNNATVMLALQQWLDRNVNPEVPMKIMAITIGYPYTVITLEPLAELTAARLGVGEGSTGK